MTIDRRFALLTHDGGVLYPYTKTERASDRTGFALSAPGERDAKGLGVYTLDLADVVRRVVFDGWKVRAKADPAVSDREGSYGLKKRAVGGFWITPELASLVEGASADHQISPAPQPLDATPNPPAAWPFRGGPEGQVDDLTENDFLQALQALAPDMSAAQRAMLVGHAQAPQHSLSMEVIAFHGGYDSYGAANLHYGALGRRFAEHFKIEGLANQTMALASDTEGRDADGHLVWEMREALVGALQRIGWVEPVSPALVAAAVEAVAADAEALSLSPTTRQALVNARIGQGLYRQKLLDLWNGQCAVTQCRLGVVLIASHAKPWALSSNAERLDEYNGLLLSATLDRLFDRGLIGFDDQGRMLCKPDLDAHELQHLGIPANAALRAVQPRHRPYLAAHRNTFGFAA
jgi:hypothetical protein